MILFHGSNKIIEHVDLSYSKKGKDFGRGFYLNQNKSQAYKMATRTTHICGEGAPKLSIFEIDENELMVLKNKKKLKIKIFKDYTPEWAKFIIQNRQNLTDDPIHNYDIVIGPIADDTIGVQITQFRKGYITINQFIKEVRVKGDKAVQFFFGTDKALEYLKYVGNE